jgi:RNase P/RNase MRP subunit p30
VDLMGCEEARGLQVRRYASAVLTHGGRLVARTLATIERRVDTLRDPATAGKKAVLDAG